MSAKETKAFVPPDVGEDLHVVRRFGWAVIKLWPVLPKDIQELIRAQAGVTEDRGNVSVQLAQQIEIFLRNHAGRH
jgi:hypothetical protein